MNQAGKQRLNNVGDRERLKVIAGLLVQHIGNQRNGERMAVGEAYDSTAFHGGHGAQVEIGHTLIGGKIPQRHYLQQALPAGIGDPGQCWARCGLAITVKVVAGSSGKNDSRSQLSSAARFSQVSSSSTERCGRLCSRSTGFCLGAPAQRQGKAGSKCAGGRLDVAQVQVGGVGAKFTGIEGKLVQQRGLADAARAVYVHHVRTADPRASALP